VPFPVHAITLDLDDTVWPIAPVIVRAEAALTRWLREHAPRTADHWSDEARLALRMRIAAERPDLAHDFTTQRKLTLAQMLREAGDDPALVEPAFDAFFTTRCQVEHYDDSLGALQRLATRVPLAALTNGNACLRTIGLMHVFQFQLGAREHGAAKPAASIFHAACEQLGCAPSQVLHVGDDVEMDVRGAQQAGLRSCWINRPGPDGAARAWPHPDAPPDLQLPGLGALADWLDATRSPARTPACPT